jgi:hypothetical protein
MLVLLLLSTLALAGGTALASRFYVESRSERALAGIVLALFTVHGSVHALGWLSALSPVTLGVLASVVSLLMFVGGVAGDPAGPARALGALADLVRLPLEAVALTWRDRSPAWLGTLLVPLACAWSFYLSYLAPSSSWDGLWYHEPMVAWALRHHGFGLVEVPTQLEWVNGYPRFAENLMLWACAFWDRRLIDAVPSAMGLCAWLGTYVLARRVTASRSLALGAASVIVTIPASILQMRSTYIDLVVLAVFLPALHFGTRSWDGRRPFRRSDAWMTGIALGLYGSAKSNAPLFVAFLLLGALVSTLGACRRERSIRVLVHALGALALMLALVAPTYVRNWEVHHNPVWPLRVHSERAGIDFVGPSDFGNMQITFSENLGEMFAAPTPGQDYHDTRHHAFGYGLTYIGLPLFLAALLLALGRWVGGVVGGAPARRRDAGQPLALLFLTLPVQLASPAHHWGRYSLPFPALCLVLITWALGRGRNQRVADAAFGAMIALNAIVFAWAEPGWDVSRNELTDLLAMPPEERPHVRMGNQIYDSEFLRLRDATLGPSDVVAFGDDMAFVSNLWNEEMTNDVVYLPFRGRDEFYERLHTLDPLWVVMHPGSLGDSAMQDPRSGYHFVMRAHPEEAQLYARGAPTPPPAEAAPPVLAPDDAAEPPPIEPPSAPPAAPAE